MWFQLEGEPVPMEVYIDPAKLGKRLDLNIVIGTPPASTTEITQPCDARHGDYATMR